MLNNYGMKLLTLVSFSFFAVMPASAKENSIMRLLVNRYNETAKVYAEKGPEAFINSYTELSAADRKEFTQSLKGFSELPKAVLVGDALVFKIKGEKSYKLEIVDASKGDFKVNGKGFHYDSSESLAKNSAKIENLLNQKDFSLMDLLIPDASALGAGWIAALIALAAGLVTYFIVRNKEVREEQNQLREDVENGLVEGPVPSWADPHLANQG